MPWRSPCIRFLESSGAGRRDCPGAGCPWFVPTALKDRPIWSVDNLLDMLSDSIERAYLNKKWNEAREFRRLGDLEPLRRRVTEIILLLADLRLDSGLRPDALIARNEVCALEAELIHDLIEEENEDYASRKRSKELSEDDLRAALWEEQKRLAALIQDDQRRKEETDLIDAEQRAWKEQRERDRAEEYDREHEVDRPR